MKIPSDLLDKAISLTHIGISGFAWLREDALLLIRYLENQGKFVFGGDVLTLDSDGYRYNYDNWYFELEDGDTQQSIKYAQNYIKEYPAGNYAFTLVTA